MRGERARVGGLPVIPEAVLATSGKSLAKKLAVTGGQRVAEMILGTADERRLQQVCRRALVQAAQEVSPDLTKEEFIHLAGIFEDLIGDLGLAAVPVVAGTGSRELAGVWQDGLERLNYDVTTLPVGVPAFVTELCRILPQELRGEAERHDSPLFPMATIEHLVTLQERSAAVEKFLASLLPFSAALAGCLENSRKACEAAGTWYYTSHLLLALLQMPGSVALRCLDAARPGLGVGARASLTAWAAQLKSTDNRVFEPFLWRQQDCVQLAQELAFRLGHPVVYPAALFVGVLDDPASETVASLRRRMTPEEFERLRRAAVEAARVGERPGTPGVIFGGES